MYFSLLDAPVNCELTLLQVHRPHLLSWLQRLGLFVGGVLTKLHDEINYHPVRIRGSKGDLVVPAGLAIQTFVHTANGERKPLVEMTRNQQGHVEAISCGRGCQAALARLGIGEGDDLTFIRTLPHMDYVTVIDRRERTRLSEGEAASIWGHCDSEPPTQFYFARRDTPFTVLEIIGGRRAADHLATHGVAPGCSLTLEAIGQVQGIHRAGKAHITVSSPGGLRFYVSADQATEITVKTKDNGEVL
ncbi:MAG: FeoA domain-containing protein [Desulfopila sp.]